MAGCKLFFEKRLLHISESIKPGLMTRPGYQRDLAYFAHFILPYNRHISCESSVSGFWVGNYMKIEFLSKLI